jgi:hypothetical protein
MKASEWRTGDIPRVDRTINRSTIRMPPFPFIGAETAPGHPVPSSIKG